MCGGSRESSGRGAAENNTIEYLWLKLKMLWGFREPYLWLKLKMLWGFREP